MMKGVKLLFLIVLLGLPVCIYLFLQGFAENQFSLPVFFEEGVMAFAESPPAEGDEYFIPLAYDPALVTTGALAAFAEKPYKLGPELVKELAGAATLWETLGLGTVDAGVVVVVCIDPAADSSQVVLDGLSRVSRALRERDNFRLMCITPALDDDVLNDYKERFHAERAWHWIGVADDTYTVLHDEVFLGTLVTQALPAGEETTACMLVDPWGQIRGYFRGDERTEIDRLITEAEVMLKIVDKGWETGAGGSPAGL